MSRDQPGVEIESGVIQGVEQVPAEVADVISEPYYRYVLRYLHEHRSAKLEELVDAVFGAEVAASDRIATPATREPVRSSIRNRVLPELDELGYVDFDSEDQTVRRTSVPQAVFSAIGVDE